MKIKTEAGSAEEQPARDISSGDEVIHFIQLRFIGVFLWITLEPSMPKKTFIELPSLPPFFYNSFSSVFLIYPFVDVLFAE